MYIKSAITPYWDESKEVLREMARDPHTRQDALKDLADHPDPIIRYLVFTNPSAAEWVYQKSNLTNLNIDDDICLGIDIYYAGSLYDGTNPEVLIDICKKDVLAAGGILHDCYVHNLPDDAWEEGENCAFISVGFSYLNGYEDEMIAERILDDLVSAGCEILSSDYY